MCHVLRSSKEGIIHFAAKDSFDIKGLGESLVERLLESGLIKSAADLFVLDIEKLAALERMGTKSAQNIIKSIEAKEYRSMAVHQFAWDKTYRPADSCAA